MCSWFSSSGNRIPSFFFFTLIPSLLEILYVKILYHDLFCCHSISYLKLLIIILLLILSYRFWHLSAVMNNSVQWTIMIHLDLMIKKKRRIITLIERYSMVPQKKDWEQSLKSRIYVSYMIHLFKSTAGCFFSNFYHLLSVEILYWSLFNGKCHYNAWQFQKYYVRINF